MGNPSVSLAERCKRGMMFREEDQYLLQQCSLSTVLVHCSNTVTFFVMTF